MRDTSLGPWLSCLIYIRAGTCARVESDSKHRIPLPAVQAQTVTAVLRLKDEVLAGLEWTVETPNFLTVVELLCLTAC